MKSNFIKNIMAVSLVGAMALTGCSVKESTATDTASGEVETFEIKLAHVVRPTTPKGAAAEQFKSLLEEKSEGRIKVTVYPDSQMGTDQEINEQIVSGTLDIGAPFFSTTTSFVPELEVFDLPYLFKDYNQAYAALTGEVGDKFDELLEEKGFVSLGYWAGGFKQITNNIRPVETVDDLDGLKIRVSQSPLLVTEYHALNAGGISVPFSELYTSLQTGTVDGQENPYSNIASRKFYEVQDYMTITDHGFMGYAVLMNKKKFDSMPEDLQSLTLEVADEVMKWEWDESKANDDIYLQEIKDSGITISNFDDEQKDIFVEKTKPAFDEFLETEKGPEIMELISKYQE